MMTEENNKNNHFFKQVLKSIKDLDKYEDFALELPKKSFKYLLKLIAIFCIMICIFYTYQIVSNANKIYVNLKNNLPDFSYSDGNLILSSQEPVVIEEYKDVFGKIIIDTNSNLDKYEEDKQVGIVLLKDKFVLLSNNGMGQVTYKYIDLLQGYGVTEFTKQDAVNYIGNINVVSIYTSIYLVIFGYLFIAYGISILLDVLLLSLLAYMASRISGMRLKLGPSFSVGVHSITLSVLLNLIYIIVNLFTGFTIRYFGLMYSTISYIYVIVAVLMIKTDFINRQMELMKLAEEQEKVREELRKQEELNKEKEKQENKKPEEKNKEGQEKKQKKNKKENKNDSEGAGATAFEELGE